MDMKTVLPSEHPQAMFISYLFSKLRDEYAGGYSNGKNILILNGKKFSHLQMDMF